MSTIHVGEAPTAAEKRRAAALKAAVAHMDAHLSGRWSGRAQAVRSIHRAARPLKEAQRIITWAMKKQVADPTVRRNTISPRGYPGDLGMLAWAKGHQDEAGDPDHSDVQELIVKIVTRDGGILDPTLKAALARLDRDVSRLDREQFTARAARVLKVRQAVPPGFMEAELAAHEIEETAPVAKLDAGTGPSWRDRYGFLHRSPAGTRQPVT